MELLGDSYPREAAEDSKLGEAYHDGSVLSVTGETIFTEFGISEDGRKPAALSINDRTKPQTCKTCESELHTRTDLRVRRFFQRKRRQHQRRNSQQVSSGAVGEWTFSSGRHSAQRVVRRIHDLCRREN